MRQVNLTGGNTRLVEWRYHSTTGLIRRALRPLGVVEKGIEVR